MGLARNRRDGGNIWAGFVDAVTTLLMVLMFVLTIFTVMQTMLRDEITSQSNQLSELNDQVSQLADALGLERNKSADLTSQVGTLQSSLTAARAEGDRQAGLIATLNADLTAKQGELADAQGRIASFEAQVASLLALKDQQTGQIGTLTASLTDLQAAQSKLLTEKEALDLAVAKARDEISADQEAARLAAARRDALEAMVTDLKRRASEGEASLAAALASLEAAKAETVGVQATADELAARLTGTEAKLSDAEKARLAEAAAAEALRQKLAGVDTQLSEAEKTRLEDLAAAEALREKLKTSDTELTAMTLALEEQRKRAEETLTLLAAAQASADAAKSQGSDKATLLAQAQKILTEKDNELLKSARDMALLNQQMTALRAQLGELQGMLNASASKDADAKVQINSLGSQLNSALAQVAAEQKRRADLEEAERKRLALENQDLSKYRSEFFGQISRLLAGQPGVRVVGDRFVFDSEVLFNPGSADLAPEGQAQIASVVDTLKKVVDQIPPQIPWIIRVDGHTDNIPLSGAGQFADNWQLSQARALSVVKFMQYNLGFPPSRLAAAGFGEYQPVATGDTVAARAQNRRIELKLTER
ncbi:MAG: peptidoglycan -binding protein [bacterium]